MVCVRGALALVHPLVQVYTIPKTGQLSYVGHVCNFHQKVSEFLSSLPTLPCNMPYVKVRPTDCIKDAKIITAIIMVPAWRTSWKRSPVTWLDFPHSLVFAMRNFKNIKDEVPMLQKYAQEESKLNEMPWMDIARKIADGINRKDERLDSGDNMMCIEELRAYVEDWRTDCQTVDNLIRWNLFETDKAKKLAKASIPGAYLADFIFTLLANERQAVSPKMHYVVIKTNTYVNLADKLDIRNDYFRSASNTSNLMECLVWFAYEQNRYHFIMTVVKLAMDLEYPRPTDDVFLQCASNQDMPKRACVHSAAFAPGREKLAKTTTTSAQKDSPVNADWKDAMRASWESSGDASCSRQGNSERDVQEAAAESQSAYSHTAASAYGHRDPLLSCPRRT